MTRRRSASPPARRAPANRAPRPRAGPRAGPIARGFAWFAVKFRFLVLAGWVAAAVGSALFLPGLEAARESSYQSLLPKDSPALQAERSAAERFGFPLLARMMVVQRDPDGLSAGRQAAVLQRAIALTRDGDPDHPELLGALPIINTFGLLPGSRESNTTAITFLFADPTLNPVVQDDAARRWADDELTRDDALVGVTGAIPARAAQTRLVDKALPIIEIATVILIVVIVGLHFRSVGAPLVVLAAAGIAFVVATRLLAWGGERAGVSVPAEIAPLIVVLLLGVVTDYAIFFLSGMRTRLAQGHPRLDGARLTAAQFTPIIFTAGIIVAAATGSLIVASLDFFRTLGPGLAAVVLVGLLVAITFVPAAIATFGRALYWPRMPRPVGEVPAEEEGGVRDEEAAEELGAPSTAMERGTRSWRARAVHLATRKHVAAIVAVVVLGGLAAAASGLWRMHLEISLVQELPEDAEARVAAEAAGQGFAAGITSPLQLVVERPDIATDLGAVAGLERLVSEEPGVAGAIGSSLLPLRFIPGAFVSPDGDAARFVVILEDDPLSVRSIEVVRALRERLPDLAAEAGLEGATLGIAGDTAIAGETIEGTVDDLVRISVAAMAVDLLLLALFLRALVAPLYLLFASALAVTAALGLTAYVFQDLLGFEGVTYYVPFAVATLLLALGSDYNVFVVGRIWQEAKVRPLREAIGVAVPQASRAITVAGIALLGSFALLALIPLLPFRQFAFAMVVGILIDTFVVRSFLVPSLIALFGRTSYWPRRPPVPEPPRPDPGPATASATRAED